MDAAYSRKIDDGFYQCLFFKSGRNETLKGQPLNRIGGKDISDPHGHTFCLQCSIPKEAIDPNTLKMNFSLVAKTNLSRRINVSICRYYENFVNSKILKGEGKSPSAEIVTCTQTSKHDSQFPLWINYYYRLGIKHFYIYDHTPSNETTLHETLKDYLHLNLVTIIPWYVDQWKGFQYQSSPENWIAHQIWSQNDCIHRYGYLHSWILICDVDEFILPMKNISNFHDLLNPIPLNYCAFQVLHYGFRDLINKSLPAEDRPRKFFHRQRDHSSPDVQSKNFVRPKLIFYFSVHQVTRSVDGTEVFYADIHQQARLHHYQRYPVSSDELAQFHCDWITIDDNSVRTWNQFNGDRPKLLTTFQITNYPKKYARSLFNCIDTYTYDQRNGNIYFIMQQPLYGISKFFKYNFKRNEIFQTEQVQPFLIDQIQFNPINNKLFSIIHNSTQRQFILVEIDTMTLQVKQQLTVLDNHLGYPMSGSYFNCQGQLFTYHAYNAQQDHTVLITLDLANNAKQRFIISGFFNFNVYAFGYDQQKDNLLALWQYNIATPLVVIQIDPVTVTQIRNVTITPNGLRIAEDSKTFAMDYQHRSTRNKIYRVLLFYDKMC